MFDGTFVTAFKKQVTRHWEYGLAIAISLHQARISLNDSEANAQLTFYSFS